MHVHVHVHLNKTGSCTKLLVLYSKKFLEGAKFGVLIAIHQNKNLPFLTIMCMLNGTWPQIC